MLTALCMKQKKLKCPPKKYICLYWLCSLLQESESGSSNLSRQSRSRNTSSRPLTCRMQIPQDVADWMKQLGTKTYSYQVLQGLKDSYENQGNSSKIQSQQTPGSASAEAERALVKERKKNTSLRRRYTKLTTKKNLVIIHFSSCTKQQWCPMPQLKPKDITHRGKKNFCTFCRHFFLVCPQLRTHLT